MDTWDQADSATVLIRGSKTDQYNLGCMRSQHRVGGVMCPVGAMRIWQRIVVGPDSAIFCENKNNEILRIRLQVWLKAAAAGVGLPPDRVGTHSLRVGGATALYNAGWELGAIQRFGRWMSNAFHGYLWDSQSLQASASVVKTRQGNDLHVGILRPPTGEAAARVNPSRRSQLWACAVEKMY
ncbi:unnamed protein product [Polarella glacialis]|uniref:Tyr recombinase domain-containing protein n=1 Tax=Polarella glacialis TaxID=89957 RepID=A0A813FXS5_POLGL|nr:unnamed protein product [Polarella glacialis]